MSDITLDELLDASIGSPDVGAVNFRALRSLLQALLKHLNIQSLTAPWRHEDADRDARPSLPGSKSSALVGGKTLQCVEDKLSHIEKQIAALERLPNGPELLSHTGTGSSKTPVNDMWQLIQLRAKVEASEDGVAKCMSLIQHLMGEIHELQDVRCDLKNEVKSLQNELKQVTIDVAQMANKVHILEKDFDQVEELKNAMTELKEKVAPYPQPEELSGCVTWEVMQATLLSERQNIKKEVEDMITKSSEINSESNTALMTTDSSTAGSLDMVDSHGVVLPQHGTQSCESDGALPLLAGQGLSWFSKGAERYPETLEALRGMGKLQDKHERLEARVELLENRKADLDEVQRLGKLLSVLEEKNDYKKVLEEVNRLKTIVDMEMANLKKVSQLDHLVTDLVKVSETSDLEDELAQAQDEDRTSSLTTDVQDAIQQLQKKYKELQGIATHLMDDHNQKQSHIELLYKAIEKLEEKKADMERVEMEIRIKADKQALETKVSRSQFDTLTEQLNGMFQELLSKITGQEQDWHTVVERISTEMDCKLNRIELDPLKKQLEDRWRSIRKQLQAQPIPEHNDAAGIRKQLVARFHCISCSRPIDMITPGPNVLLVPSPPRLPCHKSSRPYTTYELDQVRQYCRSERIPEMANYSDLTMTRNCGGSHTITYANRRFPHLKHISHLIPAEENSLEMPGSALQIQPEEVDILGLDGHIYKGRLNSRTFKNKESRLPTLSSKGRASISPI